MNKILNSLKKEKTILINLRVTAKEKKEMQAFADKYAGGNLSLWLRHRGSNSLETK